MVIDCAGVGTCLRYYSSSDLRCKLRAELVYSREVQDVVARD